MSPRYILARAAKHDLETIYAYTFEKWGLVQAEQYAALLFAGIERLTNNPALGHRRNDIPKPYRAYAAENHIIIYRIADPIEVLNILHPAMDMAARLR